MIRIRGEVKHQVLLALGLGCLFVVGCGPIRAGGLLMEASAELSAAETAQAPKRAPYEYWAAHSYLRKAKEDHSYANYETAEIFAAKSVNCAQLARAIAEKSARKEMGASKVGIPEDLICPVGTKKARFQRAVRQDQLYRSVPEDVAEPVDPSAPRLTPPADPEPTSNPVSPSDEPLPPGDDD